MLYYMMLVYIIAGGRLPLPRGLRLRLRRRSGARRARHGGAQCGARGLGESMEGGLCLSLYR